MQSVFKSFNVDIADADTIFRLMDENSSGLLTPLDLINVWLRLRGLAKSMDVAVPVRELDQLSEFVKMEFYNVQSFLELLSCGMDLIFDSIILKPASLPTNVNEPNYIINEFDDNETLQRELLFPEPVY